MKLTLLILSLTFGLSLSACASKAPEPTPGAPTAITAVNSGGASADLARIDQQGAVVVEVTPLNLDAPGRTLDFQVALNTHSINLDMDFARLATLSTDSGNSVQASAWEGPNGGHHVMGTMQFPATENGKSLLEGATKLTLTLKDVDAPERTFSWDVGR